MAEKNLFEDLKEVLTDFKEFLDSEKVPIQKAISGIAALIPQVNDLIDLLADLLGKMKTEINNLEVNAIPGLNEFAQLTEKLDGFLESAKKLLPDETDTIDAIGDVADVVTGLPSLDDIKVEIVTLIDEILALLIFVKSG